MSSTPQSSSHPVVPDGQEVVVGVDTHKDFHVAAVVTALGVLLDSKTFPTTRTGYQALVTWARGFGVVQRAGVECTGSYGAALARHLAAVDIDVFEVNQPDKANRRRRGKNDAIDAESAARSVLNGQASALAKGGQGPVEMLRMFKVAKTSAVKSRTQAINQLKTVLVSADPVLRDELRDLSTTKLVQRCIAWHLPHQPTAPPRPDTPCACSHAGSTGSTRRSPISTRRPPPSWPATTPPCSTPMESARHRRHPPHRRRRQPRTAAKRNVFRRAVRRQPSRSILGQDTTPPTQPRRRPPSQLRLA